MQLGQIVYFKFVSWLTFCHPISEDEENKHIYFVVQALLNEEQAVLGQYEFPLLLKKKATKSCLVFINYFPP